ncbi:hypothetical protein HDV05_002352, partial [Chytridiales sp. JEL 0842]
MRIGNAYGRKHLSDVFVQYVLERFRLEPTVVRMLLAAFVHGQQCNKWPASSTPPESHHVAEPSLHILHKSDHLTFTGQLEKAPSSPSTNQDPSMGINPSVTVLQKGAFSFELQNNGLAVGRRNRMVFFRLKRKAENGTFFVEIIKHQRGNEVPRATPSKSLLSPNPFGALEEDSVDAENDVDDMMEPGGTASNPTISEQDVDPFVANSFIEPAGFTDPLKGLDEEEPEDPAAAKGVDVEVAFLKPAANLIRDYLQTRSSAELSTQHDFIVEEADNLMASFVKVGRDALKETRYLGVEELCQKPHGLSDEEWIDWVELDDRALHECPQRKETRGLGVDKVIPGLAKDDVCETEAHG